MAEIILDLTGKEGLADGFFGQRSGLVTEPNLILNTTTGQMASGYFTDQKVPYHLSPVANTATTITTSTTPYGPMTTTLHEPVNQDVYFGDGKSKVYKLDNPYTTSLTEVDNIKYTSTIGEISWDRLLDLESYFINGEPKSFFVGAGLPIGSTKPIINTASLDVSGNWKSIGISIRGSDDTIKPVIESTSSRFFSATTGASLIESAIVTTSGTNRMLVLALITTTNDFNISSVTYLGDELELMGSSTGAIDMFVYGLKNPQVGSARVQVNLASETGGNAVMRDITLSGVNQSAGGYTTQAQSASSATASTQFNFIFKTPINLSIIGTAENLEVAQDFDEIAYVENTTITHGVYEYKGTGSGLQVGYSSIPWNSTASNYDWFQNDVDGKFIQDFDINNSFAFLRKADNGFMYLFVDNQVHKIDGNTTGGENGRITKNVLLFPEGFKIKDAVDSRSNMFIGVHEDEVPQSTKSPQVRARRCGILIWDRVSTAFNNTDYVEIPGVRELKKMYVSPDGMVKLIAVANSGLIKVLRFGYNDSGGVVFRESKLLGYGAYPFYLDSLDIMDDSAVWIAADGDIYTEKDSASVPTASTVSKIFNLKANGSTLDTVINNIEPGALTLWGGYNSGGGGLPTGKRLELEQLIVSYKDGSTVHHKGIAPLDDYTVTGAVQYPHQGDVYSGVSFIPIGSNVRRLRVYNLPTTTSGTSALATIKLYFNQSATVGMTKTVTMNEAKRGYLDFNINKSNIHSVQIEIEWNTAVAIGTDTYHPSVAVISYDPSNASGPDNE